MSETRNSQINPGRLNTGGSTTSMQNPLGSEERPTITISLPSGWARAGLAGVCAALFGFAVPTVLATLGFWSVADNPWLKDAGVQSAIDIGANFFALSLGSAAPLGSVIVGFIPLLWTLIIVLVLRLLLLSVKNFAASSAFSAIPFFTLTSAVLLASSADGFNWWRAMVGAFCISFVPALWAALSAGSNYPKWFEKVQWLWGGLRTSLWWFAVLAVLAGIIWLWVFWQHRDAVFAVNQTLGAEGTDAFLLTVLQLSFLPNFFGWTFAWMLGDGFTSVGGQVVSPAQPYVVDLGLPFWKMLPTEATDNLRTIVLILGVAVGLISLWFYRKFDLVQVSLRLATAASALLLLVGLWMWLSRGGLGPGQLHLLGPEVGPVVKSVALLIVLPVVLIVLLLHPVTLRLVKHQLGLGVGRIRERASERTGPVDNDSSESSSEKEPAEQATVSEKKSSVSSRSKVEDPTVAFGRQEAEAIVQQYRRGESSSLDGSQD